jgi:hypothetical protein
MPRNRTEIGMAAGMLISSIQREWNREMGTEQGHITEQVMELAHGLLQAEAAGTIRNTLGSRSVTDYLGPVWARRHPSVMPSIERLESLLGREPHAVS